MSDNSITRSSEGSGWGQLGLLAAAGSLGALFLLTRLSVLIVPGMIMVIFIIQLRASLAGEGVTSRNDQSSAKPDELLSQTASILHEEQVKEEVSKVSSTQVAEAAPAQPPTTSPARRSDIFAAATAKPAITSSPQQVFRPSLSGAVPTASVDTAPAAAANAPVVQLTPTRSLVPDQATETPKASNFTEAVSEPKAAATSSSSDAPPAGPVPVTGGAAILARFRKQRTDIAKSLASPTDSAAVAAVAVAAAALPTAGAEAAVTAIRPAAPKPASPPAVMLKSASVKAPPVTILYGSQTGTCLEIARNLTAEAVDKGFNATCASLNEQGFAALSAERTPVLIIITSSTGDGDPPDNASAFFVAMRRKLPPGASPPPPAPLTGIRYTVLGLGDSNYTRFMYIPRAIKGRLAELGATEFYRCAEADEVEGVENVVDPWTEGLWAALKSAVVQASEAEAAVQVEGKEMFASKVMAEAEIAAQAVVKAIMQAEARAAAQVEAEGEAMVQEAAGAMTQAEAEGAVKAVADAVVKAEAEGAMKEVAEVEVAESRPKGAAETLLTADAEAAEAGARAIADVVAEGATKAAEVEADVEVAGATQGIAEAQPAVVETAAPAPEAPLLDVAPPPKTAAESETPSCAASLKDAKLPVDAFEDAIAEAADAVTSESESLLPDALVGALEAGVMPTGVAAGLPTIAESRVFEDVEESLVSTADADGISGPVSLPLATSTSHDGRPESSTSHASGSTVATRQHGAGSSRHSSDLGPRRRYAEKPSSRLQAKPINVNFPKREETVVKRKDEKVYGMLMGLAPVGVDTKGAPALLPCRIKINWEKDEGRARRVRDQEAACPTREERHRLDPQGNYSAEKPFWAHVSDARYETAFWSDRKVVHLELSIRGSNITYEPGDSIGVLPINHPDLVANLCKRLHLNPDRVFTLQAASGSESKVIGSAGPGSGSGSRVASHIPSPCSVGYALSHCVDLTSVTKKSVLRLLAEHAVDAAERRTLMYLSSKSQGGKDAYSHEIGEHQPSILDLLARFRSVNSPFEALLDALPPLMPRMYSISSSQKEPMCGATHISVALSVVRFKTRYGTRLGVATTWLDRLAAPFTAEGAALPEEPIYVPIFVRRSADFKPPTSLATPMIMVGPGTGVAPFRGFLQDRQAEILRQKPSPEALGEAVLFFGCRRDDEDYLYKEELEAFKADGTLTALHVAFSRAQAEKVYVQDLIKQQGEKVWALIQAGAHIYVCGDGASMAKDVHAALVGVVQQQGGMGEQDATVFMQNLTQERRYVREVWSA